MIQPIKEIKSLGLPASAGGFEQLYNFMNGAVKKDKRLLNKLGNALEMSDEEKQISFLNNYFIFKKSINYNAARLQLPKRKILKIF